MTILIIALVVLATTGPAATASRPLPSKLVGRWVRGGGAMVVKRNGSVDVVDFTARFTILTGGRLTISGVPLCYSKKGIYRWKVSGRRLTLTMVKDTCVPEVRLFAGVWTKK